MAGLKAKSLLSMINNIYEEFIKLYQTFGEAIYDVLLPEEIRFTDDLEKFFAEVSNLLKVNNVM